MAVQTVQDVLDDRKVTTRQKMIFVVCLIITLLGGFDTQSIAFVGPAIAKDFGLQATDMAPVITASTIGMVIGAMTLGTMGDRIGRRKVLIYAW
jgi:AAHS family 4-hydroxybenzoate transporter-like MFS transporter